MIDLAHVRIDHGPKCPASPRGYTLNRGYIPLDRVWNHFGHFVEVGRNVPQNWSMALDAIGHELTDYDPFVQIERTPSDVVLTFQPKVTCGPSQTDRVHHLNGIHALRYHVPKPGYESWLAPGADLHTLEEPVLHAVTLAAMSGVVDRRRDGYILNLLGDDDDRFRVSKHEVKRIWKCLLPCWRRDFERRFIDCWDDEQSMLTISF
jgi:hypothetical protein